MREEFFGALLKTAVALVLTVVPLVAAAPAQTGELGSREELPNFQRVNGHLYRGGQPRRGGIRTLAQLGIKTIINLRSEGGRMRREEAEARSLGMRYFSVPMRWYGRPSNERIERVLALINRPENWPVFVHCRRGADRTGTVVAVYRLARDRWTPQEAQREADRFGMRRWRFGMRAFIKDFCRRRTEGAFEDDTTECGQFY